MITTALGAYLAMLSDTLFIIFTLSRSKSSLDIPGNLGLPAVTTITSESLIIDISVYPLTDTSYFRIGEACTISKAFPSAHPLTTSINTVFETLFSTKYSAVATPTFPLPIILTFMMTP